MKRHVSIHECREILGITTEHMTDTDIEQLRTEYERIAEVLFELMVHEWREGLEGARWDSYFRETGEAE